MKTLSIAVFVFFSLLQEAISQIRFYPECGYTSQIIYNDGH